VNIINGKNNSRVVALGANAQIEANMNKVFSLLREEVAVAA